MTEQQLAAEIHDVLRTMPSKRALHDGDDDALAWIGRATSTMRIWSQARALFFDGHVSNLGRNNPAYLNSAFRGIVMLLHEAQNDLRLRTSGPLSVAVEALQPFQYFDEVRRLLETAKVEVFFVDPYLDAHFVSRYLRLIAPGTKVRLLTRKGVDAACEAIDLLSAETGLAVEVRTYPDFHDRYLFIDQGQCFHSGSSFKDGGMKSATTITQVMDAFEGVWAIYDRCWGQGIVKRPKPV